jgi:hypothetical protein
VTHEEINKATSGGGKSHIYDSQDIEKGKQLRKRKKIMSLAKTYQ